MGAGVARWGEWRACLAQRNLVGLAKGDTRLKRIAATCGGERAGSCPRCGGRDRFHVQGTGRWMCRQCHPRWGDTIDYVRWRDEISFVDACKALGGAPGRPTRAPGKPSATEARSESRPRSMFWQKKAHAFVAWAERQLWQDQQALAYLRGRGLSDDTIRFARLGWNPRRSLCRDPRAWGLERRRRGDRMVLHRGWTIPNAGRGVLWGVNVRRPDGEIGCYGDKYRSIRGSQKVMYGLDTLAGREDAIIAEGEFGGELAQQLERAPCGALDGTQADSSAFWWCLVSSGERFESEWQEDWPGDDADISAVGDHAGGVRGAYDCRVRPDGWVGVRYHGPTVHVAVAQGPGVGHIGARSDGGGQCGGAAQWRGTVIGSCKAYNGCHDLDRDDVRGVPSYYGDKGGAADVS